VKWMHSCGIFMFSSSVHRSMWVRFFSCFRLCACCMIFWIGVGLYVGPLSYGRDSSSCLSVPL